MANFREDEIHAAQEVQRNAAADTSKRVRLIAGPGSGKSRTILLKIKHLIDKGASPDSIYVISFTRASAIDLRNRVRDEFASDGLELVGQQIGNNVTTMHSLALKLLANANLLSASYPAPPMILDRWQQENILDLEFSSRSGVSAARAKEIRGAYDAHWQTLDSLEILGGDKSPTTEEQEAFTSYYPTTKSLYSCLLPGEVVRSCVDEINQGNIGSQHFSTVKHLIVDEYQDLNNCDQEFVELFADFGTKVFIAGDDDQSIYAFRHAAPNGIVDYLTKHEEVADYKLEHCFRCSPAVLEAARSLIVHNPGRIPKKHQSMFLNSSPQIEGKCRIWRCQTGVEEAKWIAESCSSLISAGLEPNQILILLRSNRIQGQVLYEAFLSTGVNFEPVRADSLLDEPMPRLVHSILEIVKNPSEKYVSYRVILGQLFGVGKSTCSSIGASTLNANLNFRDLFYSPIRPNVFNSTQEKAIKRVASIIDEIKEWQTGDPIYEHLIELATIGERVFGKNTQTGQVALSDWQKIINGLPTKMTLDELYAYLDSDTEAGRFQILDSALKRLGHQSTGTETTSRERVRFLTMHGAKGLEGQAVFIPGAEQNIIPSVHAIAIPGRINEERRLMYTAITRAKTFCVLTMAEKRTANQAYLLSGSAVITQVRSQFVQEIGQPVDNRNGGLTECEVNAIMSDVEKL